MNINPDLMLASLPIIIGWVWWVDKKVSAHEAVIAKLDKLVDLLLEDLLSRQNRHR